MTKKELLNNVFETDFQCLMVKLKMMSRFERHFFYIKHSKNLFLNGKTIVGLDNLLDERKKSYRVFKTCFVTVGSYLLSSHHLGEYNQEFFKKKTGVKRSIYFQQVVLVLYLLGYINGKKMNFSNHKTGGHGTIFDVNIFKLHGSDDEFSDVKEMKNYKDWDRTVSSLEDWLVAKQHLTMLSMGVEDCVVKACQNVREHYKYKYMVDLKSKERDLRHKQLCNCNNVLSLANSDFNDLTRFSVDDKGERLYSLMTSLSGFFRLNKLKIKGEPNVEVDVTSAQPTFLGIILKQLHPEIKSQWLDHSLKGDFYEWVMEVTGMVKFYRKNLREHIEKSNSYQEDDRERMLSKIDDPNIYKAYRPIVKKWIMIYLFDCRKLNPHNTKSKSLHQKFVNSLSKYLYENEPHFFNYINYYKTNPRIVVEKGKKKRKSDLPIQLQHQEVLYIKECLKNLDSKIPYIYTVHDCVGCRESDGDKVKSIMEQTSLDMFGVRVNLKIEGRTVSVSSGECEKCCPFFTLCDQWKTT